MFDITIFPLTLDSGHEQYELPGLHVASAPRKAARLRAQDKLILYYRLLNLAGVAQPAAFTRSQQEEIVKRLADTYFTTPGSVTAGLRAVVTQLNEYLFHRNRKSGVTDQLFGVLNLASLHGDSLIVAHGGPAHSFLLSERQAIYYDDSVSGGRGLGLAGQAAPRFYQSEIESGQLLIFCSDAPASWNARTLADGAKLPLDQLRRRLVTDATTYVSAAVIRFQSGKGQVSYWRPAERPSAAEEIPSRPVAVLPQKGRMVESAAPVPPPVVSKPVSSKTLENQAIEPETPAGESIVQEPAEPFSQSGDIGAPSGPAQIFDLPVPPPVVESDTSAEQAVVDQPLIPGEEAEEFATEPFAEPPVESELQKPEEPAGPLQKPGIFLGDAAIKPATSSSAAPLPRPSRRGETAGAGSDQSPQTIISSEGVQQSPEKVTRRKLAGEKRGLFSWLRRSGQAPKLGNTSALQQKSVPVPAASKTVFVDPEPVGAQQPSEPPSENLRRGLASAVRSGRQARARVGSAASKVLPNQPFFNLSPGIMLSIAIVIPLIVATVALTVYLRSGYSEKFAAKMAMAQQFMLQAQQQQDPTQQRESWKQVYIQVNDALNYEPNNQPAKDLRRQALASIDSLEGFVRLDYQPLRDGLGQNVKITRMISTLTGVYLLDSSQGRVYRLQPTTTGYSVDPNFNCGPGKAGAQIITQLIDMAELPVNNEPRADIMAIDSGGSLVYCSAGSEGFDSQTLPPPDTGWGKITAITSLGDALFVLDPKGNAVYRYDGQNGIFTTGPHLYFDTDIPHMADVTDLAVDQEFLYLLHGNGQMTVCDSGGVSYAKTKCTDPTPYGDTRAGYESSPLVFKESQFTHIQATQPPDPALYALDVKNRSIYHLSLRLLNLQRQYLPQPETDFPLPAGAPTAFVVTSNRRAILAFGNLIYFAPIP